LKQELLDAFMKAHFVVFGTPDFTLRIGKPSAPLDALLEAAGAAHAAFITAANPHSKRTLGQNAIVYVEKGKAPELAVLV